MDPVQVKIDLFKQYKSEYKASSAPVIIETTAAQYISIDGQGEPGNNSFQDSVGALYSMAFTIKMTRKAANLGDYVICKLECLWWSDDCEDLSQLPMHQWHWKLMIRTPDYVTQKDVEKAAQAILQKGKSPGVAKVKLQHLQEGQCVQMLHLGPYEKEGETIEVMRQYMSDNNLTGNGKHHEIYLSDPRRIPAERLKTILRLPIKK